MVIYRGSSPLARGKVPRTLLLYSELPQGGGLDSFMVRLPVGCWYAPFLTSTWRQMQLAIIPIVSGPLSTKYVVIHLPISRKVSSVCLYHFVVVPFSLHCSLVGLSCNIDRFRRFRFLGTFKFLGYLVHRNFLKCLNETTIRVESTFMRETYFFN